MSSIGNNDLVDTDDSDEVLQNTLRTPESSRFQHGKKLSRTLTNRHERSTVTPLRELDNERSDTKLEKQKKSYISGKKRRTRDGDEDMVKEVVKKHIISRAKFLEGEGLEPTVVQIRMEKEGGYPPIGKNHDYPDFVNPKGLYSTILEQMNLTHKPIEKKVAFWLTWRKTVGNCIKAHRNSVTSRMKHAILKGKFCYNKSVSFELTTNTK